MKGGIETWAEISKRTLLSTKLLARIEELNAANEKKVLKTWSRPSTIFPQMVGPHNRVHDGRKHVPVYIHRRYGRTSSRRIRADQNVQRSRGQENLQEEVKRTTPKEEGYGWKLKPLQSM